MIAEFQSSLTVRVPEDLRFQLESLSQEQQKPLSRVVRAVIAAGLKVKTAPNDDFIKLEA